MRALSYLHSVDAVQISLLGNVLINLDSFSERFSESVTNRIRLEIETNTTHFAFSPMQAMKKVLKSGCRASFDVICLHNPTVSYPCNSILGGDFNC